MVGRWWSCYTQMGRVWGATAPEAREAPGQELRMNQTCSITQHSRTLSPATAADIHCGRGVLCHRATHPAEDTVQIKCWSTDTLRSSCSDRSKHNTFPRHQQQDSPPDCVRNNDLLCQGWAMLPLTCPLPSPASCVFPGNCLCRCYHFFPQQEYTQTPHRNGQPR